MRRVNCTFLLFFLVLLSVIFSVGIVHYWLQIILLLDETDSADVGRDYLLLFTLGRMLLLARLRIAMIDTITSQSHGAYSFDRFIFGC